VEPSIFRHWIIKVWDLTYHLNQKDLKNLEFGHFRISAIESPIWITVPMWLSQVTLPSKSPKWISWLTNPSDSPEWISQAANPYDSQVTFLSNSPGWLFLGPLRVVWQVSFGCWVTWSISSWQEYYKSVFFPKAEWWLAELIFLSLNNWGLNFL
jgi:hypothetical protein